MEDLNGIRKRIRRRRQSVADTERIEWSRKICDRVLRLDEFNDAQRIAGFLAFDGEADPLPLMTQAVEQNQQVFVPVMVGKGEPLRFAPWTTTTKMKRNRSGINEPDLPESEWIDPTDLDFVITPLVAFDESCHRIGVGGGFYDRSFSFVKEDRNSGMSSVTLIGFAFELQRLDVIEPSPWDVPIDGVATESGLYRR